MNRRHFALTALSALGAAPLGRATGAQTLPDAAAHPLDAAWGQWKAGFVSPEGRVIDTAQGGASHSESQSYGMILAVALGDADSFARILAWSLTHLAQRDDALLAWRWLPDGDVRVPDLNNASDGDLFFAWALCLAAQKFGEPGYLARARQIAQDLARLCVVPWPDGSGRTALLPASDGFRRDDSLIVNLSYAMPLALRQVAVATGVDALRRAADDAEGLMAQLAAFGTMPDWFALGPFGPEIAPGFSDHTGYEALRIPLFLLWSGNSGHPAVQRHAAALRAARPALPAMATPTIVDRLSGTTLESSTDPGYRAVAALIDCVAKGGLEGAFIPPFTAAQPYYPATLHLMALLAELEGYPGCLPL